MEPTLTDVNAGGGTLSLSAMTPARLLTMTGRSGAYDQPMDLGHGVSVYFMCNREGFVIGLSADHPRAKATTTVKRDGRTIHNPPGSPCGGFLRLDVPATANETGSRWKVESWWPLTLTPSVLCTVCGQHGWIRDGRWVSA